MDPGVDHLRLVRGQGTVERAYFFYQGEDDTTPPLDLTGSTGVVQIWNADRELVSTTDVEVEDNAIVFAVQTSEIPEDMTAGTWALSLVRSVGLAPDMIFSGKVYVREPGEGE